MGMAEFKFVTSGHLASPTRIEHHHRQPVSSVSNGWAYDLSDRKLAGRHLSPNLLSAQLRRIPGEAVDRPLVIVGVGTWPDFVPAFLNFNSSFIAISNFICVTQYTWFAQRFAIADATGATVAES